MALETAGADITINTFCPACVKTPLVEKQIAAQARTHGISEGQAVNEIMLKPMPKRAFIGIDEIAGIVAFLISPPARNITGQTIVVDGAGRRSRRRCCPRGNQLQTKFCSCPCGLGNSQSARTTRAGRNRPKPAVYDGPLWGKFQAAIRQATWPPANGETPEVTGGNPRSG